MIAREKIISIIEPVLQRLGYELYDIKVSPAGKSTSLKVFIDSENGIKIADCESASHEMSATLDVENVSRGRPYTLEVSSPGLDRPLKTAKDFQRASGQTVRIIARTENDKTRTVTGKVLNCLDQQITLETVKGEEAFPLTDIISGKIELIF
jgi:ribosome maturation factor RimP